MVNVGYGGAATVRADEEPYLSETSERPRDASSETDPADLHVYCINLERSPLRRQYMVQQAAQHGLAITFIEAIDGRQLDLAATPEYRSADRRASFGWDLAATEVAVALSHRRALEAIRAAGHARAIVLEDDVALTPDFKAVVRALYARPDLDFDLIRLFGARDRRGAMVTLLSEGHSVERPYRPMCGLQAYMVNAASIDRVIRAFIPITMQIDVALDRFWENDLKILRMRPFIVVESNKFGSDIAAARDHWRHERRHIRLGLRLKRFTDHIKRAAYILRKF